MAEGPLFEAVRKHDLEQMKKLLASGIKPDAERDWNNGTPLLAAAINGKTYCAIELIKAKADVNHKDKDQSTPLMVSAWHRSTDCAIELIKAKADVNQKNDFNDTALMWAASCGNTDMVIALVKAKVNVNTKNNMGGDAIAWAKECERGDIVSMLEQARDDFEGFLWTHMTDVEKSNACRREYARAFVLASRVTKSPNSENITMSKVQRSLPPGYRDIVQFFGRNPGLVKWTGIPLLLYFNAGCQSVSPSGSDDDTYSSPGEKR